VSRGVTAGGSAVAIHGKRVRGALQAPAGMVTVWKRSSTCETPYPSSQALKVPVRGAGLALPSITPAVAVQGAVPVSNPGLPRSWLVAGHVGGGGVVFEFVGARTAE